MAGIQSIHHSLELGVLSLYTCIISIVAFTVCFLILLLFPLKLFLFQPVISLFVPPILNSRERGRGIASDLHLVWKSFGAGTELRSTIPKPRHSPMY